MTLPLSSRTLGQAGGASHTTQVPALKIKYIGVLIASFSGPIMKMLIKSKAEALARVTHKVDSKCTVHRPIEDPHCVPISAFRSFCIT